MDKIDEAFNRYAENGWFFKDAYYPWVRDKRGELQRSEKARCWHIQFSAYDGYHVSYTCETSEEADAVLKKLNSFKDPVKCREYLDELKNGECTLIHSLKVTCKT